MKHSAESISLQQQRVRTFLVGTSHVLFSARLGLKFLVCLCFALGGRLTRDSKQTKQALVPRSTSLGGKRVTYTAPAVMVYISFVVVVGRLSQPFPHGEKKVLPVCLSLVGTFILRVVAPSSPIT